MTPHNFFKRCCKHSPATKPHSRPLLSLYYALACITTILNRGLSSSHSNFYDYCNDLATIQCLRTMYHLHIYDNVTTNNNCVSHFIGFIAYFTTVGSAQLRLVRILIQIIIVVWENSRRPVHGERKNNTYAHWTRGHNTGVLKKKKKTTGINLTFWSRSTGISNH